MTDQVNYIKKIAEYQKVLAQDNKSLVFVPLAGCFLKSGLLDDALETALKGTWELPDYSPGFVAVARIYKHRQAELKAIAFFQKAIDLDPSCLDAYKGMALIYREQGNSEAASNLLTKAVFLFPEEQSLKQMLESITPVAPTVEVAASPAHLQSDLQPITTATIAEIYIKQGLYDKALEVYRELYTETNDPTVAQKIAEIESLSQGSTSQPTMAVPSSEANPSPVVTPTSATRESGLKSSGSVLDNLNSMLASIQSRRNRV